MGGKISRSDEQNLSAAYKNYAKMALMTQRQIEFNTVKTIASVVIVPFELYAIIRSVQHKIELPAFLGILVLGLVISLAAGYLFNLLTKGAFKKLLQIERTEGYSDNFIAEALRLSANGDTTLVARAYICRGELDKAIEALEKVDSSVYVKRPTGAHMYYSTIMMAYLLVGNMEKAEKAYNEGFYYMNTYRRSPLFGSAVSLALGIYEYYCGHYEMSMELLNDAAKLDVACRKPENRIPDENSAFMISYWIAMCNASMGNKAAAWDIINSCRSLYTTDYYRKCADKLIKDMAEDEKRKNEVANETIS